MHLKKIEKTLKISMFQKYSLFFVQNVWFFFDPEIDFYNLSDVYIPKGDGMFGKKS